MHIIVSLFAWIGYVTIFVLFLIPTFLVYLVTYLFDKDRIYSNWLFMFIGRAFFWFNPLWKVRIEGLDQFVPGKPTIFVANHQSFLDMPLLALLPWQMKWVSKDALFRVPLLGWYMRMSAHISVKRGTTAALKALDKLKPYLRKGIPVMLFPEGTRSRSGELIKFKSGAFMLSKDTGAIVQPILIWGSRDVMKPDTWKATTSGEMVITLMKPYAPTDFKSVELMRDKIYADMKGELDHLDRVLR